MWFFSRKRSHGRDAEVEAIKSEIYEKIDQVNKKTDRITELLEKGGTTELILLATGRLGKRR